MVVGVQRFWWIEVRMVAAAPCRHKPLPAARAVRPCFTIAPCLGKLCINQPGPC